MAHATLLKFGYPQSCIFEDDHWAALLRAQQVTLGAMVLCAKSDATALATLPPEAFVALGHMTAKIDQALKTFYPFDKINYLALMMVDPHVHFHVLPRYATPQIFEDVTFVDNGWPALPDLKSFTEFSPTSRENLRHAMTAAFVPQIASTGSPC